MSKEQRMALWLAILGGMVVLTVIVAGIPAVTRWQQARAQAAEEKASKPMRVEIVPEAQRWEYETFALYYFNKRESGYEINGHIYHSFTSTLDVMGSAGWEFTGTVQGILGEEAVFKRRAGNGGKMNIRSL